MLELIEIRNLLQKTIPQMGTELVLIKKSLQELGLLEESAPTGLILYELAKLDSTAALLLWHYKAQNLIKENMSLKNIPITKEMVFSISTLYPDFENIPIFFYTGNSLEPFSQQWQRPASFNKLKWQTLLFSYNSTSDLDVSLLCELTILMSALIAGLKVSSIDLAKKYSHERQQGGRWIYEWPKVSENLNSLYLEVESDFLLLNTNTLVGALKIISNSDRFVSQCMQIFGGAGYIKDYKVEQIFRDIFFLKNWIAPLSFLKSRTNNDK